MLLKTHYTAEEAHSLLRLLDEICDTLWRHYRDDITEYCREHITSENGASIEFEDDQIPF